MRIQTIQRLMLALLALILAATAGIGLAQEESTVRFGHFVPDASPIDVYINNTLAVTNLAYGNASGYVNVPAGDHTVTVTPTGLLTPIWQQSITATANTATTFIAADAAAPTFNAVNDNLATTGFGGTRLLLVHAIAAAPAVDVALAEPVSLNGVLQDAGTVLAANMGFGESFGAFDLPAQSYSVNVVPAGGTAVDAVLSDVTLPLNAGTSYIAVVYGTPDTPAATLLAARTGGATEGGLVRFVHGVVGAPAVDVYVNDTLVAPALSVDMPTEHMALPAGDHTVLLRAAGTEDEIATGTLSVTAGSAQTVAALSDADSVSVSVFTDDLSALNPGSTVATVLNTIPDSSDVSVTLADGTSLSSALSFGDTGSTVSFGPTQQNVTFALTIDGDAGTLDVPQQAFYGGVYYNIIALAGDMFNPPRLLFAPTVVSQGIVSAPGGGSMVVFGETGTTQQTEDTTAPVSTPEPPPVVAQPPQPTPAPAQPTLAPAIAFDPDALTGRIINLDPGVNLQLRQYPSRQALSLGLAPGGTDLEVVGREGAPVALVEGDPAPPEAEDFVDPAEDLGEDEDLNPEETWLRVIYPTPDGGTISAWVLAQYVEVRDAEGDLVALKDIETFGGNVPGEAINTAITPPSEAEDRVTVVVTNLNAGVNLNIRRTPVTTSEVLTRLSNNTVMDFVGLIDPADDPNGDWVFIEYQSPQGGIVTGWASTLYVRYEYNGRDTDLVELDERELLAFVDADRIGEVRGSAPSVAIPTPDPQRDAYVATVQLDPGANLQFRSAPNAQAESLNLIPSGTSLIITGRTADAEWLSTTFEGQQGWISAQFVSLTFNGQDVPLEDVPVDPDAPGAAG